MSTTDDAHDRAVDATDGGFMARFRCVIIGGVLAGVIGVSGCVYLQSMHLWYDYHNGGVVFLLLVALVFCNLAFAVFNRIGAVVRRCLPPARLRPRRLMLAALAWVTATGVVHGSALGGGSPVWGYLFFGGGGVLALLVFGMMAKCGRLRGSELMVMGAMMFASGSIASSGLIVYFLPSIATPLYYATPANQWHERVVQHVDPRLLPFDAYGDPAHGMREDGAIVNIAVREFWEGIDDEAPIHWGPWLRPLANWGAFFLALFGMLAAVMAIMRKQWMDYEHLSFPIAQIPGEICAAVDAPRAKGVVFRSYPFWIGLGVATALLLLTGKGAGIATYQIPVPWLGVTHKFPLFLDIVVIGLVFLIPNRIALSVWAFALAGWLFNAALKSYALDIGGQKLMYGGGAISQHVIMGAVIVFVLSGFYTSRRHLRRALRCALGRGEAGYDAGEVMSYRSAFLVVALGGAFVVGWLCRFGMTFLPAVLLLLLMLIIFYAITRVIAQCGLPVASAPSTPSGYLNSVVGSDALGKTQVATLAMHAGWYGDLRNLAMTGTAHGMALAKRRRSGLFWAMMAALIVTYVTGTSFSVYVCNRFGGASSIGPGAWTYNNQPQVGLWWASWHTAYPTGACTAGLAWGSLGAILMGLLMLASRTLFWWPLHPVGLLLGATHMTQYFWLSVFLAWLTKAILIYLGGNSACRTARRFFIGAVVGCFMMSGFRATFDAFVTKFGDVLFGL
jgi:uncharacterized protein DUF6785/uncharacterized protein DUF6784